MTDEKKDTLVEKSKRVSEAIKNVESFDKLSEYEKIRYVNKRRKEDKIRSSYNQNR